MSIPVLRLVTILCTAIALAAGLAHLFALPNKIHLSAADYFTVQQIYSGWNRLAAVIAVALVGSLLLSIRLRGRPGFGFTLAAATLIAAALAVFFLRIFPANQATRNWTERPDNWELLRRQWESGHAIGAVLYLLALASLTWSAVAERR